MCFHPLVTVYRLWLRGAAAGAECLAARGSWSYLLIAVILLGLAPNASANISVTGSVVPIDNPFTAHDPNVPYFGNEGLPPDGSVLDPSLAVDPNNPKATEQPQFEFVGGYTPPPTGSPPGTSGTLIPLLNNEIVVGQKSLGAVLIQAGTQLRSETLIIGDSVTKDQVTSRGTGIVRITGFGSLYNNDPTILPFETPTFENFGTIRLGTTGYDLYVGRNGDGTLEIRDGGRAEIQDAVFVGATPSATGTILVDGSDSFLGSSGSSPQGSSTEAHSMLIGPRGIGYLTISNGGTVNSFRLKTAGNDIKYGAVIGSDGAQANGDTAVGGGVGTVTVEGTSSGAAVPTSRWIVGDSFQVGGFSYRDTTNPPLGLDFDPEGDQVLYSTSAGRGTLNIKNGGLVNILSSDPTKNPPDPLYFLNGKFGQVNMSGGEINVGGLPGNPTQLQQGRDYQISLINDGLISGSGTITTGNFLNRYSGQVRVRAGEKLVIDAEADFSTTNPNLPQIANLPKPLTNYGRISVTGTVDSRAELEFVRFSSPPPPTNPAALVPVDQPFYNRTLPIDSPLFAGGQPPFDGGEISAQHATLRFRSGIENRGVMAFTAGENIISGRVDNVAGKDSNGRILISPNTTVTSEDDFASGGLVKGETAVDFPILTLREGSQLNVLNHSSFTLEGHLDMELSHSNPAKIDVAGDVGLNADLYVSFDNNTLGSLSHGDAFELIYFAGFAGGVNATDPTHLVPDLTKNPILNVVPDPTIALLHPNLDLFTVQILQSIYLLALDPSMIGSSGAIGPDFNGDGVVDGQDLTILQDNLGCESGCSVLQGDADGDGDVDGDDFLFWQRNAGRPMPWTGAGSGAAVPEPAGFALLAIGLMALPAWRRRIDG